MDSVDVRRIMKREAIKTHLNTEVIQLKKKMMLLEEEHKGEIADLTDKYYDECERNDELLEEVSCLRDRVIHKNLFIKALLNRVREAEQENKVLKISLQTECKQNEIKLTSEKTTQVSFPRKQIKRIRKTFRSFTRSNRVAPFLA